MIRLTQRHRYVTNLALVAYTLVVCLFIFTVRSPISRPIWYDEFLQYAFAGFDLADIWGAVRLSIRDINHGQTGVMAYLNAVLLKLFGGSHLVFRLPSALATIVVVGCSIYIVRLSGLGICWQALAIAAISHQTFFAIYATEARPYIFLAASVSLTLLYYLRKVGSATNDQISTNSATTAVGFSAVAMGCLFHPYFPLYWIGILLCSLIYKSILRKRFPSLKEIVYFADLKLVLSGIVLFCLVSYFTWLDFNKNPFALDPFQWIKREAFPRKFLDSHFAFILTTIGYPIAVFVFTTLFGLAVLKSSLRATIRALTLPVLLILMALISSLVISFISYKSGYWILERQWIASSYLIAIAFTVGLGNLASLVKNSVLIWTINAFVILAVARSGYLQLYGSATALRKIYNAGSSVVEINSEIPKLVTQNTYDWVHAVYDPLTEKKTIQEMHNIQAIFVNLAEAYLVRGDNVPPSVARFYCTSRSIRASLQFYKYCE